METSRVKFMEMINKINLFSPSEDHITVSRYSCWTSGSNIGFDSDLIVNILIEISSSGNSSIIKQSYLIKENTKKVLDTMEDRFFTNLLEIIIKKGFKTL